MSNKITAVFGADISEVEQKMVQATRATKAYERAVRETAKTEGSGGGGNLFASLTAKSEKTLGTVKALSGALGGAAAAAGLVPGIGWAAVGVAAVVAGVNAMKDHYEKMAEFAKSIAESATKEAGIRNEMRFVGVGSSDRNKQEIKEKRYEILSTVQKGTDGSDEAEAAKSAQIAKLDAEMADLKLKELGFTLANKEADKKKTEAQLANIAATRKAAEDTASALALAKFTELQSLIAARDWGKKTETEQAAALEAEIKGMKAIRRMTSEQAVEKMKLLNQYETLKKSIDDKETERQKSLYESLVEREDDARDEINKQKDAAYEKNASNEEKLTKTIKAGREALAKFEKEKNSENELAVRNLRAKYQDLKDAMSGASSGAGDPLANSGRVRGEDGKLRRGNVIVSDADAARADDTKAKNMQNSRHAEAGSKDKGILVPLESILKEFQNLTAKFK